LDDGLLLSHHAPGATFRVLQFERSGAEVVRVAAKRIQMNSSMRERSERRRRIATARVVRISDDDGSFDRAFWSRYSPSERMALAWQMVLEWAAWRGVDADQLRLRRSVTATRRLADK
jgi:hypothetical protein